MSDVKILIFDKVLLGVKILILDKVLLDMASGHSIMHFISFPPSPYRRQGHVYYSYLISLYNSRLISP